MDTVRARIERAIIAGLETLNFVGVGGVVDGRGPVAPGFVTGRKGDGLCTIELLFGDDEIADGGRQTRAMIDVMEFEVGMLIHLPVSQEEGRDDRTLRSDVQKALVPLMCNGGVAYGNENPNPALGPGWGDLAENTENCGGFGQGSGAFGPATVALFAVRYRHRRGDATSV